MGKAFSQSVSREKELVFNQNYLDRCQIATPKEIAEWAWQMVHAIKDGKFKSVLDLGCGDGRFSLYGKYNNYKGVEIDQSHSVVSRLPENAVITHDCALLSSFSGHDLCIGNPPYVRHHDMDNQWREAIVSHLGNDAGVDLDQRGNAFLYFMLKALLSTTEKGLVAMIVPFEWVTRPSSAWLRNFIDGNNWKVSVYRLPEGVFPGVLTTASLSIIEKSSNVGGWDFYNVDSGFNINKLKSASGTNCKVLSYERRLSDLYAQRGLSPGTQKVFCLNEEDRLHNRLRIGRDVVPCLTSTKSMPSDVKVLTEKVFDQHFVKKAMKCWLIRSDKKLSKQLGMYLDNVDLKDRSTATCLNRDVWYKYNYPGVSELLFGTGFVRFGPHVLENHIGAVALGSVGNVFIKNGKSKRVIANHLRSVNFERRVVNQSGRLKKIEINQLNSILKKIK